MFGSVAVLPLSPCRALCTTLKSLLFSSQLLSFSVMGRLYTHFPPMSRGKMKKVSKFYFPTLRVGFLKKFFGRGEICAVCCFAPRRERHEVVISPHCSSTMGTPQYLILALLGRRYSSPFGTTRGRSLRGKKRRAGARPPTSVGVPYSILRGPHSAWRMG